MNKRYLRHAWIKVRWVKPWYFLVLAIISAVICVLALRANNQHMIRLRDAVYKADQDNTDLQKPLQALQAYVTTHMNTDLNSGKSSVYPPVQLKYTYERLTKARLDQLSQANAGLYNEAQTRCEAQNQTDISGRNRVPCIEQYVQSHTAPAPAAIPDALYKFSFVSPRWSPDTAGWSMVIAVTAGVLFAVTFIAGRIGKRLNH